VKRLLLFLAFAFFAAGCATEFDAIHNAINARNEIADLEPIAAKELHTRCTAPMELLAASHPTQGDIEALAKTKKCDHLEEAYDGERRSRLALDDKLEKARAGQSIKISDVLDLVDRLMTAASALEKEIAQ
jgi:hypothetical protein